MFKNKLFLYGLGTGLITATLLLQLLNYSDEAANMDKDTETLTQTETAENLDTLFIDQFDALTEAAERNGYRIISDEEEASSETNDIETDTSSVLQEADNLNDSLEEVLFTISSGMGSGEVARQLHQLNLIKDVDEFMQLLNNKQLNTRIQIGSYRFEGSPDMNQIIKQITNS